jgi:alpha-L-fucosidase 2
MLQKYQSYPNGMTNNTNGVFEFLGVHLNVMNESLVQSYDGKIRVFPAPPSDGTFVGRFTLAARGGFLVTSEQEGGDIKYVGIKSLLGNTGTVVNPWSGGTVEVRDLAGGNVVLTSSGPTLTFPTAANGIYVVERVAKPLSSYTYTYLTGTRNDDAKYLSPSTGLGIGSPPNTHGKYEAESATLTGCSVSSDLAASNFAEVTGLKQGSSVAFANVSAGSAVDIRYCTMNNPGKLTLYVNGASVQAVTFPNTQSWSGTYATVTVMTSVPQGATLKLQYDAGGSGANLDYIQVR